MRPLTELGLQSALLVVVGIGAAFLFVISIVSLSRLFRRIFGGSGPLPGQRDEQTEDGLEIDGGEGRRRFLDLLRRGSVALMAVLAFVITGVVALGLSTPWTMRQWYGRLGQATGTFVIAFLTYGLLTSELQNQEVQRTMAELQKKSAKRARARFQLSKGYVIETRPADIDLSGRYFLIHFMVHNLGEQMADIRRLGIGPPPTQFEGDFEQLVHIGRVQPVEGIENGDAILGEAADVSVSGHQGREFVGYVRGEDIEEAREEHQDLYIHASPPGDETGERSGSTILESFTSQIPIAYDHLLISDQS